MWLVGWQEHLSTEQLAWMLNTHSVVASLANKCLKPLRTKIFPGDSCPVRITLWLTLHSAKKQVEHFMPPSVWVFIQACCSPVPICLAWTHSVGSLRNALANWPAIQCVSL